MHLIISEIQLQLVMMNDLNLSAFPPENKRAEMKYSFLPLLPSFHLLHLIDEGLSFY